MADNKESDLQLSNRHAVKHSTFIVSKISSVQIISLYYRVTGVCIDVMLCV